jgi:hypothetical protein
MAVDTSIIDEAAAVGVSRRVAAAEDSLTVLSPSSIPRGLLCSTSSIILLEKGENRESK